MAIALDEDLARFNALLNGSRPSTEQDTLGADSEEYGTFSSHLQRTS